MMKNFLYITVVGVIFLSSCKEDINRIEPDTSSIANPYDGIDYGNDPTTALIDSSSYLGLHEFIFSKKCAVPACHDGAFEPDFRTIEGSYNNLVYHTVVKNNSTNDFTYRVLPGDTAMSWLHERITTDDAVLGKMPLYDVMSNHEIEQIEKWILAGAKNVFDVNPSQPDMQPTNGGVLAFLNDTSGVRLDTIRDNPIMPMKLPNNSTVEFWFLLYDQEANGDFVPGASFTYNKIKISDHPFEFSGVTENNLTVQSAFSPAYLPVAFGGNFLAPYYHSYSINTANFTPGKTYFMRIYVKDADHSFNTEIPENGSQTYLLTYFSFIVQ